MMKLNLQRLCPAVLAAFFFVSCGDDSPVDPAKNGGNGSSSTDETEETEYTIDSYGYATYEYQGFTFKLKQSVVNTDAAQKAVTRIKSDLDNIVSFVPEEALEVMQSRAIWMEENNTHNSSAAWYHKDANYPVSIGDLAAKGKCVEITNYNYYVSWTAQNQPYMLFHELSHLYHDQGLGGDSNTTISNAYNSAVAKGLYKGTYYRSNTNDSESQWTTVDSAYCLNDSWEYFAEMSEAYWGENDYYPFEYIQLEEYDSAGFSMCQTIWGERF